MVFLSRGYSISAPDEGMWLPMFVDRLNYTDMQAMGLNLTAEEIYSINNSSLKDAIVGLSGSATPNGFFCTGGIVSDQGLLFTNHHCGYDVIQQHSSLDHDYLTDGFWAAAFRDELPNENLSASFLVRMEDVTDSILPFLSDTLTERDRRMTIGEITGRLEERASEEGKYHVNVNSFYGGNEYYLFVYEVYQDVRLVGAPPSAIGKFGGDTDNWMWPRHTGDFSIFRVYSAPDGSPATYSDDNVPLKPRHFLPISLKGIEKDDFAMIWGYPGGTQRYLTSYGVKYNLEHFNPAIVDVLGKRLETMKEEMDADPAIRIALASDYAGLANAWKLYIGQTRGIKRLKLIDRKTEIEDKFTAWVSEDPARKEKYGNALSDLKSGYEEVGKSIKPLMYLNLGLLGPEIVDYASGSAFYELLLDPKENKEMIESAVQSRKELAEEHFAEYHAAGDKKMLVAMLELYVKDVPADLHPQVIKDIHAEYKGDFKKYADDLFEESIFADKGRMMSFLDKPSAKKLGKDPAYILSEGLYNHFYAVAGTYRQAQGSLSKGERLFIAGLREMNPDKVYYPDANSTMRLTYGSVQDYIAADAVHYDYITTSVGILEKEDPDNEEFIVPARLKQLIEDKDFGPYGNADEMVLCFLTTNDITGGNSGSPVINGDGELIGLAFDGNWEAMSGDIVFEPELQRTICVDSRYVLFVIDKYAGAQNLIEELKIVK
ncbi:MAG: S46 family peptidase [Bacteroidales bacterium]|nr:S46 family peptidase [Bacteroidales bacterium]